MELNEYQNQARFTAIYPDLGRNFVYPTLGLCGESGEYADKVKKIFRDNGGILSEAKKAELKKELGDILWYIALSAYEIGVTLDDVAKTNLEKLSNRKANNTLHGNGDNR